jgi:hypothetical protein
MTLNMRMSRASTVERKQANFGMGDRFQKQRNLAISWKLTQLQWAGRRIGTERVGGGVRCLAMAREIESPADELREDGTRAKHAGQAAIDPREKERLERIAKKDQAKALDIENDFS